MILSYFFPRETWKLRALAEECALSRLFGGVHYPIDNDEGLRLGRQMGKLVVNALRKQDGYINDRSFVFKDTDLMPPPYEQVIPYDRAGECGSLVVVR